MYLVRLPLHRAPLLALSLLLACSADPPTRSLVDPEIVAFAADPSVIREGGTATLRWLTNDAVSISIHEQGGAAIDLKGASPEAGEVEVSPTATTTYVLVASNSSGKTVDKTATLEVIPANEVVAELWLEPEVVTFGEKAHLRWNTVHAEKITIHQDGRLIINTIQPTGSHEIVGHDATEFTLEAEGMLGTAHATARLEVAPAIDSFSHDVEFPKYPGELVEVEWRTRGAESLRITDVDGLNFQAHADQADRGKTKLPVPSDGIFVLVATRQGVEAKRELEVPVVGPPEFNRVNLDPPAVTEGSGNKPDVRLSWQIANAKSLRIESSAHGLLDLTGKRPTADVVVVPTVPEGTTFRLLASNGRVETEEVVVFEGVPLPTIETFRAIPERVGPGEPFFLVWEVEGAVRLELHRIVGTQSVRVPLEDYEMSDAIEQTIAEPTAFELVAFNLAGDSVKAMIGVSHGEPEITARLEPEIVLPGEKVTISWESLGGNLLVVEDSDGAVLHSTDDPFEIEEGSHELTVPMEEGAHAYFVRSVNASGTSTAELYVTVTSGPRVREFSVSPNPVRAGHEVEFSWKVQPDTLGRPTFLEIHDDLGNSYDVGDADPHEGRVVRTVTAAGYRTFTLRARADGAHPTQGSVTSAVFDAPELTLVANPAAYDPFKPGDPPRLRWQTMWATRVLVHELDGEGGILRTLLDESRAQQVAQGSLAVQPEEEGSRYRVVAENPWGESESEEIDIPYYTPTVDTFTVTPTTVAKGGTVTVSWVTHGGHTFLNGPLIVQPMEEIFGRTFTTILGQSGTNTVSQIPNCQTGTGSDTDEGCATIDLPTGFQFPWDGRMVSQVRMGVNGWLGLNTSVPGPGFDWSGIPMRSYPSTSAPWSQIIPFGADLWSGVSFHWKQESDDEGQLVILEWRANGAVFQVALRESGVFETRYGSMPSSFQYSAGYQNFTGSQGINFTPKPNSGQLANRIFRYEPRVSSSGSMNVQVSDDTTFRICVYGVDWERDCEEVQVTVTP